MTVRSFLAQAVVVLGVGLGLFPVESAAQEMKIRPEAYLDAEGIWRGPIPVCWVNPEGYLAETSWVEETIIQHIEGINREVSRVRFVGLNGQRRPWAKCAEGGRGIRVRIAPEWPRSHVGQQWARDISGKRIVQDGRFVELPTEMVLNFTFGTEFPCLSSREHCIRAIALHEFMHALGFLHEQLHPDAPPECRKQYEGHRDFHGYQPVRGTPRYDHDSHMNYCTNMYRVPIRLSEGDVSALRFFYTP